MGPRDCQPQLASHLLLSTPQITALGQLPDVPGLCACHPLPECLYCLFEILILLEGPFRTSPPVGPSPAPEAAPQGLQLAWAPLSELSGPFPSLYLNCQGQLLCSGPDCLPASPAQNHKQWHDTGDHWQGKHPSSDGYKGGETPCDRPGKHRSYVFSPEPSPKCLSQISQQPWLGFVLFFYYFP